MSTREYPRPIRMSPCRQDSVGKRCAFSAPQSRSSPCWLPFGGELNPPTPSLRLFHLLQSALQNARQIYSACLACHWRYFKAMNTTPVKLSALGLERPRTKTQTLHLRKNRSGKLHCLPSASVKSIFSPTNIFWTFSPSLQNTIKSQEI